MLDIRLENSTKRVRKKFTTKGEALRFESYAKHETINKPWEPKRRKNTRLSELFKKWYEIKGSHLDKGCSVAIKEFIAFSQDAFFQKISKQHWHNYQAFLQAKNNGLKTIKNKLGYLNSFFNYCIKNELLRTEKNPFADILLPKLKEKELHYLTLKEIQALLEALEGQDREIYLIAKVCLSTGARLGEVQNLTRSQIQGNKLYFTNTKSKKNRAVGITEGIKAGAIEL